MTNVEALKALAATLCGVQVSAVTGTTNAEVIDFIADNYAAPTPAAPTDAGTYNLVVDAEGVATWTAV